MEEITAKTQLAKVRNYEKGFVALNLINIGAKLGVFEALNESKEGMTPKELASQLGLHEPYFNIWCQTAYHFQVLDCDESGRYKFQPFLDEILGDPTSIKNYVANVALMVDICGKMLVDAPEYYRTGQAMDNLYTPELTKIQTETTKNLYIVFLHMIFPKIEKLKERLEQGVKFLDIGCGGGVLITELAKVFKNTTFVGIDQNPHGIEAAKNKISNLGLGERVLVENIGGENLSYENEFDLVSMVCSFHEFLPELRPVVLQNAYRALKTDGTLLILDMPFPCKLEDFRSPNYDFGILDQFFEACMGIRHLNSEDQNEMFEKMGFKNIQRMYIGKGMFEAITATK
jgi:ubiquinone/menaquinone biosynthesis C-methylase UbiE